MRIRKFEDFNYLEALSKVTRLGLANSQEKPDFGNLVITFLFELLFYFNFVKAVGFLIIRHFIFSN